MVTPNDAQQFDFLINNCLSDTFASAKIEEQCHELKMPKGPVIAIVIDDLGEGTPSRTDAALEIPGITAAFIPVAGNPRLQEQVQTAHDTGHEIIMHTPMETGRADVDIGDNRLMTDKSTKQIQGSLWWDKKQFGDTLKHFAGFNNHQGSKFTQDLGGMKDAINYLDKTTDMKYVLDSKTSGDSKVCEASIGSDMACVSRDVFLDHVKTEDAIRTQIEKSFEHASIHGSAIAIGHHYTDAMMEGGGKGTISLLKEMIPELSEKYGVTLVPVSDVVERRLDIDLGAMP